MKYGTLGKNTPFANNPTVLYELPIDSDADTCATTIYITNTSDSKSAQYIIGTVDEGEDINNFIPYDLDTIKPSQHIIKTKILLGKGEKIVALSSTDEVNFRVEGLEEKNNSTFTSDIIKWITAADLGNIVGNSINLKLEATNATSYQVIAGSLPVGVSLDTNGNLIGNNPRNNQKYRFTVRASNGAKSKDQMFTFISKNRVPDTSLLTHTIPNQLILGQSFVVKINGAVDPDNDEVFYNIELPTGMSLSAPLKTKGYQDNEEILLKISPTAQLGNHQIKITAIDDKGGKSTEYIVDVQVTSADIIPNGLIDIIYTQKAPNTFYEAIFELTDLEPNYGIIVEVQGNNALLDTFIDTSSNYSSIFENKKTGITTNDGKLTVKVRMKSSDTFDSTSQCRLNVSGLSANFVIGTRSAISNPQGFEFISKDNVELDTEIESDVIIVYGLEPEYKYIITATDGTIFASTNANDFVTATYSNYIEVTSSNIGTFMLSAKVLSAKLPSELAVMTVSLGNKVASFTVRTREPKIIPTPFAFTNVINATPGIDYFSETIDNIIEVKGLEKNYTYYLSSNGNGGFDAASTKSSLTGLYNTTKTITTNNDGSFFLRAKLRSSLTSLENVSLGFAINNKEVATFNVKTILIDDIPDNVLFTHVTGVDNDDTKWFYPLNALATGYVNVTGLTPNSVVTIKMKNTVTAEYIVGTNSLPSSWNTYSDTKTIQADMTGKILLNVRNKPSNKFDTTTTCTIVINNSEYDFNITTRKADIIPDSFTFDVINVDGGTEAIGYFNTNVLKITGLEPNYEVEVSSDKGLMWISNIPLIKAQVESANNTGLGLWQDGSTTPLKITTDSTGSIWIVPKFTTINLPLINDIMMVKVGSGSGMFKVITNNTNTNPTAFEHTFPYIALPNTPYTNIKMYNGIDTDTWDAGKLTYSISNSDANYYVFDVVNNIKDITPIKMTTKPLSTVASNNLKAFHKTKFTGTVTDSKGGFFSKDIIVKILGNIKLDNITNANTNDNIKTKIYEITGFDENDKVTVNPANATVWVSDTLPSITENDLTVGDYAASKVITVGSSGSIWVSFNYKTDTIGNKTNNVNIIIDVLSIVTNSTHSLTTSYNVTTKNDKPLSSTINHNIPSIFPYDNTITTNSFNNIKIYGAFDDDLTTVLTYKLSQSSNLLTLPSTVNDNINFTATIVQSTTKYKNIIYTPFTIDITPNDGKEDGDKITFNTAIKGYIDIPPNITAIAGDTVFSDVVKISGLTPNTSYPITSTNDAFVSNVTFTQSNETYKTYTGEQITTNSNGELFISLKIVTNNLSRGFNESITIDGVTGIFNVKTVNIAPTNLKVFYSEDGYDSNKIEIININSVFGKNSISTGHLHFFAEDDFIDDLKYTLSWSYPSNKTGQVNTKYYPQQRDSSNNTKDAIRFDNLEVNHFNTGKVLNAKLPFTTMLDTKLPYNYVYYTMTLKVTADDNDSNGNKSVNKTFDFRVRGGYTFNTVTAKPADTDVIIPTIPLRGFKPNESVTIHVGKFDDPKTYNGSFLFANSSNFTASTGTAWIQDSVTYTANSSGEIWLALKVKTGKVGLVTYKFGVQINDDDKTITVIDIPTVNTAPNIDSYIINNLPSVLEENTTYSNLTITNVTDAENHTFNHTFTTVGSNTSLFNTFPNVSGESPFTFTTKSMSVLNETDLISIYYKNKIKLTTTDALNASSSTNDTVTPLHIERPIKRKTFSLTGINIPAGVFGKSQMFAFKGLDDTKTYTIDISTVLPIDLSDSFKLYGTNIVFNPASLQESNYTSTISVKPKSGNIYFSVGGKSKATGLTSHKFNITIDGVTGTYEFISGNTAPVIDNMLLTLTDYKNNTISPVSTNSFELDENTDYRVNISNITDKENHTYTYKFTPSNITFLNFRFVNNSNVESTKTNYDPVDHIRLKTDNIAPYNNSTNLTIPEQNVTFDFVAVDSLSATSNKQTFNIKIKCSFTDDNNNLGKYWEEQGGYYAGKYTLGSKVYALIVSKATQDTQFISNWYIGSNPIIKNPTNPLIDGFLNCEYIKNNAGTDFINYPAVYKLYNTVNAVVKPNGFSDWYIASRYEHTIMFRRFKPVNDVNSNDATHGSCPNSFFTNERTAYLNVATNGQLYPSNPLKTVISEFMITDENDITSGGADKFRIGAVGSTVDYITSSKDTNDNNIYVVEFRGGTLNNRGVHSALNFRLVRRVEVK